MRRGDVGGRQRLGMPGHRPAGADDVEGDGQLAPGQQGMRAARTMGMSTGSLNAEVPGASERVLRPRMKPTGTFVPPATVPPRRSARRRRRRRTSRAGCRRRSRSAAGTDGPTGRAYDQPERLVDGPALGRVEGEVEDRLGGRVARRVGACAPTPPRWRPISARAGPRAGPRPRDQGPMTAPSSRRIASRRDVWAWLFVPFSIGPMRARCRLGSGHLTTTICQRCIRPSVDPPARRRSGCRGQDGRLMEAGAPFRPADRCRRTMLCADRGDAGRRLDLVLSRHLAGLEAATRTRIQRWIAEGRVAMNGAPVGGSRGDRRRRRRLVMLPATDRAVDAAEDADRVLRRRPPARPTSRPGSSSIRPTPTSRDADERVAVAGTGLARGHGRRWSGASTS